LGTFHSWYNIKAAIMVRFGLPSIMSYYRELIYSFKQRINELLIHVWERFRGLAYEQEHGLRDWMIMHTFYCGLSMNSKSYANYRSGKIFFELTIADAHILLDGLLLKEKIKISFDQTDVPSNHLMIDMILMIFTKKRNK
jgi:hypothetical protein